MPKISLSKSLFYSLLGDTPSSNTLEKMLLCAKAELDDEDEDTLKIELNDTNRPDLWTTAGLVRQLKTYHYNHNITHYPFFSENVVNDKYITVEKSVQAIRPYMMGFLLYGKKLDKVLLDELIQMQEKICDNFGQKRKAVAIGIFRDEKIQWPITYKAEDASKSSFIALGETSSNTLKSILKIHQKGKEYGHLISQYDTYPLLRDNAGEVLSMPPIINSAFLGSVEVGDDALFVECSGDNLEMLFLACAIFACDCYDIGFSVQRLTTHYKYDTPYGKSVDSLQYFQDKTTMSMTSVKKILGEDLPTDKIIEALTRMGISIEEKQDTHITARPPVYRNDFLHEVDIVEDVMTGHGIESFVPTMPTAFTIGRLSEIEIVSRRVLATMVGLGFQEMLFPYLGSASMFVKSMYPEEEWDKVLRTMIKISNPVSENYEYVRISGIPQLLETERVSSRSVYPHKICELGKVALQDATDNYGSRTETLLSFLIASSQATFTEINDVVASLLYYEQVSWHVESATDSRFIEQRCGQIVRKSDEKKLGIFGEIHPHVLEKYDITMPCVAGELLLDNFI